MSSEFRIEVDIPRVSLLVSGLTLIAPVQIDLYGETLDRFQTDVLAAIEAHPDVDSLLLDLSALLVLDIYAYDRVCRIATMAGVMGVRPVLTGIRPGVAWALIDLGADSTQVPTKLTLEDGLEYLEVHRRQQPSGAAADSEPGEKYGEEPGDKPSFESGMQAEANGLEPAREATSASGATMGRAEPYPGDLP